MHTKLHVHVQNIVGKERWSTCTAIWVFEDLGGISDWREVLGTRTTLSVSGKPGYVPRSIHIQCIPVVGGLVFRLLDLFCDHFLLVCSVWF